MPTSTKAIKEEAMPTEGARKQVAYATNMNHTNAEARRNENSQHWSWKKFLGNIRELMENWTEAEDQGEQKSQYRGKYIFYCAA